MSKKIVRVNYENMISQLQVFAKDVSMLASNMQVSLGLCKKALDENDKSVEKICTDLTKAQREYLEVAKKAAKLASDMKGELGEAAKEDALWN